MHILLVVGKFPDLTFIFRTATGLAARGHQVTVAARKRGDWRPYQKYLPLPDKLTVQYLLPEGEFSDLRLLFDLCTRLPLFVARSPGIALRLLKFCMSKHSKTKDVLLTFIRYLPLLRMQADIVHFDFAMTASSYQLLPALLHTPTVVSCRGSDVHLLQHRSPQEQQARITAICSATALHCVSDEIAATVNRISGRSAQVWVNRPAVPITEIQPKAHYENNPTPLIIWVGRLDWIKGLDYLLAAFAQLKRNGCVFKAQLIGEGDLRAILRFSIADLDLTSEVELVGKLPSDQVWARLRAADLFVLSSHDEGISNAVLEAMAVGVPIVTTAAGGMSEAVRDGVEGFVVPIRDIPALTDRIQRLLVDAGLRQKMGQAARARAEAEFSLNRQAQVFEQIYQAAVSDIPSSR